MTKEEHEVYEKIDFCAKELRDSIGAKQLPTEDKKALLIRRWREPCLSIHGIEGAYAGVGDKTIIPCKVTGKFSIRI
ncbi:unnamed protein product, partial [Heligmosomoides polygyrus]|uniref:PFL domain-containing protein n=1 Tax=Heligmosomoides polygyrus TaxID=6339 RepID=A0A183FAK9_HELPZ